MAYLSIRYPSSMLRSFLQVCLVLLPVYITRTETADYVTLGHSFIFGFLEGEANLQAHLYLTTQSQSPVWVNVSVPTRNFSSQFTVKAYSPINIDLPDNVGLVGEGKQDHVVLVDAKAPVSVYGVIKTGNSVGDGFTAIPISHLGTEYYIASYIPDHPTTKLSQIALFGTEDGTTIRVHTPNSIENVNLNKHEAFQVQADIDLTGTLISSNKPIAVLGGAFCATVPHGSNNCAYLIEQIPDVTRLGRKYLLSPLLRRDSGYIFRVISTMPETNVDAFGTTSTSVKLESGMFYQGEEFGSNTTSIIADKPVLVMQYTNGDLVGNPFMTVIPSIQMFHEEVNFFVPQSDTTDNFISITARCSDGPNLILSDLNMGDTNTNVAFTEVVWDAQYSHDQLCVYQKHIKSGTFKASVAQSPHARFFVLLYGLSEISMYSYALPVAFTKEGDACSSNPCLNGATCFNRQSRFDFICLCQPGWEGKNCHRSPTPHVCDDVVCHNRGRCYALEEDEVSEHGEEDHVCLCQYGWGGQNCTEDVVNECENNLDVCSGVGECIDGHGTYTCQCEPGYTGRNCEMGKYAGDLPGPDTTAEVIITAGVIVGCLCLVAVIINVAFITRERCNLLRRRRRFRHQHIEEFRNNSDGSVRRRNPEGEATENEPRNNDGEERETGT